MYHRSESFFASVFAGTVLDTALLVVMLIVVAVLVFVLIRSLLQQRRQTRKIIAQEFELALQRRAADMHAMVSICDAEGRLTYVNDNLERTTGYDRSELLGKAPREVYLDDNELDVKEVFATLARGEVWTGVSKLRHRRGNIVWAQTTALPQMTRAGELRQIITVRTDITESKLRQQEGPLRAMFDRLQDEVYIFSAEDFGLQYLNKRARASLGWEGVKYRGRHLRESMDGFDDEKFRERIAPLVSGEIEALIYESTLQGRPVEINLQIDESISGEARFIAVVRDISQRKAVEQARSAFVATVSHELRAPMTSIKGSMKLVASGATGPIPEKPAKMIALALRNVDRLLILINDLLDLEKLDNTETEIRRDPVDLAELAYDAIAHNMGYAQECGITFAPLPGMPRSLRVAGDRDRLMQVLTNLMSNAAKFSEPGGVVHIGVEDRGEVARIAVIDQGIGIPEEAQARLFDRFAQADTVEHKKRKGTGLGLSIVKTIVERHGGRVDFKSVSGEGTTFLIDLPKVARSMSRAA